MPKGAAIGNSRPDGTSSGARRRDLRDRDTIAAVALEPRLSEDANPVRRDGKSLTGGDALDANAIIENHVAADAVTDSSVYVPTLQLTAGQPPPIAANGGLSYMSFDRDGDAGTAAAIEAALEQVAEGHLQAFIDWIDNAPPGPIETKWGLAFRGFEECLDHIRANGIEAPEGGLALPAALHRLRAAVVLRRAVQRAVAGPGAPGGGGGAAQGGREHRTAQPLLPAGAARCAPHRGVLPRPRGRQPRVHGPARRLACAPRIEVRELLRLGGGGTRLLPRDREAPPGVLPGRDGCARLQPRRLRQGLPG